MRRGAVEAAWRRGEGGAAPADLPRDQRWSRGRARSQESVRLLIAPCAGDCNGNHEVSIDELILSVSIALGEQPANLRGATDTNRSNSVEISELVAAVAHALGGCA